MRGTPLMLQMFAIYFAPYYVFGISLTPDSKWTACVVAFIINYAGYFAEIYRSGLQSIPRGQYEAAEVLGYSRVQTFLYIVMPQGRQAYSAGDGQRDHHAWSRTRRWRLPLAWVRCSRRPRRWSPRR